MHPFVIHYLATKNASFEKFCEAALTFDQNTIVEIEKHVPSGTAINYISKIRALRGFVVGKHLTGSNTAQLIEALDDAGIRRVNDISRRKLNGEYAQSRSSVPIRDELANRLQALDRQDLLYIRDVLDRLISVRR